MPKHSELYPLPPIRFIGQGEATSRLYELESRRNDAISAAAEELGRVLEMKRSQFWSHLLPETLLNTLESFDKKSSIPAAIAFLQCHGYLVAPPVCKHCHAELVILPGRTAHLGDGYGKPCPASPSGHQPQKFVADPHVEVHVEGGIADVMAKPRGVSVTIRDFDDQSEEGEVVSEYEVGEEIVPPDPELFTNAAPGDIAARDTL